MGKILVKDRKTISFPLMISVLKNLKNLKRETARRKDYQHEINIVLHPLIRTCKGPDILFSVYAKYTKTSELAYMRKNREF